MPEKTATNTDVAALSRLVNLPFAPTSVQWRIDKSSHGDNWGLSALLAGKPHDVSALLDAAERLPNCHAKLPRDLFSAWLPSAVQSAVRRSSSEQGEGMVAVDAICIRPTSFTVPEKSPAIHGDALVFERHNLVFLSLYTL